MYFKKHGEKTGNPSITIYVSEIKNRITFKKTTGYSLELLTPEMIKSLGSNRSETTKDKNGKNVPYLEIMDVVLVHCNIFNNDYQQNSRVNY